MENLMREVLINRSSRNKKFLAAFIAANFDAGQPWG